MKWLKRLLWAQDHFPAPWPKECPSIFSHLSRFEAGAHQGLPDEAMQLPDEDRLVSQSGSELRWAPGAMDGVLGHHTAQSDTPQIERMLELLTSAAKTGSADAIKAFYDLIVDNKVLGLIDALLDSLSASRALHPERLRALARWLAKESPDREAVKVGMALLGRLQPPRDTALLVTLGLHDEFTLYAAVALGNTLPAAECEDVLWSLAKRVHGWGRIQLVERLWETRRPQIKDWLLREGYRNSVLISYLAYSCAVGGDLLGALKASEIDDALLHGAGDILQALIEGEGGPVEGMSAYADGAQATLLYLEHLARRMPARLADYLVASDIARFVDGDGLRSESWQAQGWTAERRAQIAASAKTIVSDARWPPLALAGLQSESAADFWLASTAAQRMGLDPWEAQFERQRDRRSDQWFFLMQTDDRARIERVAALAMTQLDLNRIATGPARELGLGPAYAQHAALAAVLQDLGRFPSIGWPLVEAGLRSPVVRNRHMALKTLSGWGSDKWPAAAEPALKAARDIEPDDRVRENITRTLSARPLE